MQLDLRGTRVSRETAKAWRDAKPGRHACSEHDTTSIPECQRYGSVIHEHVT